MSEKVLLMSESMTLVNPNTREWRTAWHGQEIVLKPFEEVQVPIEAGKWLLIKAKQSYDSSKVDAADAYQQYLELSSKSSHAARMMADKMLGPDGKLKDQAWDFSPAICVDTKEGREIVAKARKSFEKKNMDGLVSDMGEEVKLLKPQDTWSRDQLRDYIDKHYGVYQPAEKEQRLYQTASRLYELQKHTLDNAGKKVVEV